MGEKELGYSSGIDVFCAGAINQPLLSPWSTMTMTKSNPWESGNPMMISTKIEENRRGDLMTRGDNLGTVGWVFTLAA